MARAREERSAAVRELEEVAEDAKVQREKVGKLEQERRASLELQSASEQLSKQRDSLQSEVEALRNELKAREEKNRELEASTRARDASLDLYVKNYPRPSLARQKRSRPCWIDGLRSRSRRIT